MAKETIIYEDKKFTVDLENRKVQVEDKGKFRPATKEDVDFMDLLQYGRIQK